MRTRRVAPGTAFPVPSFTVNRTEQDPRSALMVGTVPACCEVLCACRPRAAAHKRRHKLSLLRIECCLFVIRMMTCFLLHAIALQIDKSLKLSTSRRELVFVLPSAQ